MSARAGRALAMAGALLAGVLSAGQAHAAAPESAASPSQGQAVFRQKCGICHLENGTGTFMLGRRLGPENALLEKRPNLTADYVAHVVRWGLMSMPRFSRVELPDSELKAVAAYLSAPQR
jgi:mono/diheme cytochrome c family protein